jgi:hypothetical protein
MKYLQDYKTDKKHGKIYKVNNKYEYRSLSGKTVRVYDSIKQLVEGENGQQNNQAEPQEETTTPEVVAEATDES